MANGNYQNQRDNLEELKKRIRAQGEKIEQNRKEIRNVLELLKKSHKGPPPPAKKKRKS